MTIKLHFKYTRSFHRMQRSFEDLQDLCTRFLLCPLKSCILVSVRHSLPNTVHPSTSSLPKSSRYGPGESLSTNLRTIEGFALCSFLSDSTHDTRDLSNAVCPPRTPNRRIS